MNTNNNSNNNIQHDVKKMAKGTGLVAIGEILGTVLLYLTGIVITRTIGAQLYGLYFLGNIITNIGAMVSKVGLDFTVLRYVAFYNGKKQVDESNNIINSSIIISTMLSLIMTIVIYLIAPWIANSVFSKPQLCFVIRILTISIPFINITSIIVNVFLGFNNPKDRIKIENVAIPGIKLILVFILFYVGMKLAGVVFATIIASIISACYALFLFKQNYHQCKFNFSVKNKNELIKFSVPVFGETVLNYLIYWIDILLLGYLASSNDVGVFGVIFRITMMIVFLQYAFNAIFSPMISELFAQKQLLKIEKLLKIQTRWSVTFSLPLLIIIVIFPENVLGVFGNSFKIGVIALIITCFGRFFDALVGTVGMMLMMIGKPKINTINSLIILILKIALNLILIPKYGLIGAAISCAVSIALLNIFRVIEVYYFLKIHPYNLKFMKPIIAASMSTISILLFQILNYLKYYEMYSVMIFLFMYFILLFIMKLEDDDKVLFNKLYSKFVVSTQV